MAELFLILVLGSPFLLLLAWHVWRDARGGKRNKANLCYSSGCTLGAGAQPLSHHKGGQYVYCKPCAQFHSWVHNRIVFCTGAIVLILIALLVFSHWH
jgi:hypothetical protein